MDAKLRIVTQLPLQELWRNGEPPAGARVRSLDTQQIRDLLRSGPVQFVIVDAGKRPEWIQIEDCFQFWKAEVLTHLANESSVRLEDSPGEYAYFASQWEGCDTKAPVVVLEKMH
jgi:hypothetical protein